MAGSRFEYVREYERDTALLPGTWLVVRVDGRGWGKLSAAQARARSAALRPRARSPARHGRDAATATVRRCACSPRGALPFLLYYLQGWIKPCDGRAAGLCASAAVRRRARRRRRRRRRRRDLLHHPFPAPTYAQAAVMADFGDCVLAFGQSDEYSFFFPPAASPYGRRGFKLASAVASVFSASAALRYGAFFPPPAPPLAAPPSVDARVVAYPSLRSACDYGRWRQVDCYINAMYNEAFWALRRAGATPDAAHAAMLGTSAASKHDILHEHGLNFAHLPAAVRRGTTLVRTRGPAHARWLLAGGELAPAAGAQLLPATATATATVPTEATAGDALPDTDPGMDMGALDLPPNLLLCFPDFCRGEFIERALAER